MIKSVEVLSFLALVIYVSTCFKVDAATYDDLLDLARRSERNPDLIESVRSFSVIPKLEVIEQRNQIVEDTLKDLHKKTTEFLSSFKKNTIWNNANRFFTVSFNFNTSVDPELKAYKSLLASLKAHDVQEQSTEHEFDCVLYHFHSKQLQGMLFILQQELEVLSTSRGLAEPSIILQLNHDQFKSKTDAYEAYELNDTSRSALIELQKFMREKNNPNHLSMSEAVKLYVEPSKYMIGRTINACKATMFLKDTWNSNKELARCDTKFDLFQTQIVDPNRIGKIIELCSNFLVALSS